MAAISRRSTECSLAINTPALKVKKAGSFIFLFALSHQLLYERVLEYKVWHDVDASCSGSRMHNRILSSCVQMSSLVGRVPLSHKMFFSSSQ